jgi:hypothetical protein
MAMTLELEPSKASLTIGNDYASENTVKFTITLNGKGPVWLTLQIPKGENGVVRNLEDATSLKVETPETVPPRVEIDDATQKKWKLGDSRNGVKVDGSTKIGRAHV